MRVLNAFDFLPEIFSFLTAVIHPFFLLGLFSLAISLAGGWVFRRVSNQKKMGEIVDGIWFYLLEMRLPNRTPGDYFRAQFHIIRLNLKYLYSALLPSLVIIVPIVMALFSFEGYFAYWPVRPGEVFTVEVVMRDKAGPRPELEKKRLPEAVSLIEADPQFLRWAFRAKAEGEFFIPFQLGGTRFSKRLVVSDTIQRVSPENTPPDWLDYLLNRGEESFDPKLINAVKNVVLPYQPVTAPFPIFGWKMDWLSYFLLTSLVFILITKKMLRIR